MVNNRIVNINGKIATPTIIPGDYVVQVHYYSDRDSENALGTNSVVVIGKGKQNPVNYYGYLSDSGDLWEVTVIMFTPLFCVLTYSLHFCPKIVLWIYQVIITSL